MKVNLKEELETLECRLLMEALRACNGKRARVARALSITPHQVDYRMRRYGFRYEDWAQTSVANTKLQNWR